MIDPLVGTELPLELAPEGLTRLSDRRTVGKVVLLPGTDAGTAPTTAPVGA